MNFKCSRCLSHQGSHLLKLRSISVNLTKALRKAPETQTMGKKSTCHFDLWILAFREVLSRRESLGSPSRSVQVMLQTHYYLVIGEEGHVAGMGHC